MIKKVLIVAVVFLTSLSAAVAQEGINFRHISWSEAKAEAIKENKLIFVDFYTQWCGPCFNMAETVFKMESVGNFYNANFINLKIDAEAGEGVELAKKFKAFSYPTYVFIDPKTEEGVHFSGSRQEKDMFIYTGKSALEPKLRSVYLEAEAKKGNKTPEFLIDYARFSASRYNRKAVASCLETLITMPEYTLENAEVWDLYSKNLAGRDNAIFAVFTKNIAKLRAIHGTEAVDAKLRADLMYCPDLSEFDRIPDFVGKSFLIAKNKADIAIRTEKYDEAGTIIDALMADPNSDKAALCDYLKFLSRNVMSQYGSDRYPQSWMEKCMGYAKYVTYNSNDRDEAGIHFEYARILENIINTLPQEVKAKLPKAVIETPKYGTDLYTMRPPSLKAKPKK